MGKFMVAMPVPDGVEEEGSGFTDEVQSRWGDYVQSRRRLGVTRERGWLQKTPGGNVFILLLEGSDPVEANRQFATSQEPFDLWFKERAGGIFGADFNQPIPIHPEPIYRSVPEGTEAKEAVALAVPILPGKTGAHRRIAEEVSGPRKEQFDAFHQRAGVLEDWWIEETQMGDLALVYLEAMILPVPSTTWRSRRTWRRRGSSARSWRPRASTGQVRRLPCRNCCSTGGPNRLGPGPVPCAAC